jgi:hypothetical protein
LFAQATAESFVCALRQTFRTSFRPLTPCCSLFTQSTAAVAVEISSGTDWMLLSVGAIRPMTIEFPFAGPDVPEIVAAAGALLVLPPPELEPHPTGSAPIAPIPTAQMKRRAIRWNVIPVSLSSVLPYRSSGGDARNGSPKSQIHFALAANSYIPIHRAWIRCPDIMYAGGPMTGRSTVLSRSRS